MKKERLDILLVDKGLYTSREQARRAIMAGLVLVDQQRVDKAGTKVPVEATIEVKGQLHPYVSRGGLKLEKAIRHFSIDMTDKVMLDIGSSTGGFTDCALQNGASLVYAIDVGYGQLAWKLRQDPRVVVMERTNFRYLERDQLTEAPPNFASIDVSFISLALILPNLANLLEAEGEVVALIKPQFEAGKDQVGKKGIVRDSKVHEQVIKNTLEIAALHHYHLKGLTFSPIRGQEGNVEFLAYFSWNPTIPVTKCPPEKIVQVVIEAHGNSKAEEGSAN